MTLKEKIKKVQQELRKGEPFYFIRSAGIMVVGFRMGFDEQCDEYEIFVCEDIKQVKSGLYRKK